MFPARVRSNNISYATAMLERALSDLTNEVPEVRMVRCVGYTMSGPGASLWLRCNLVVSQARRPHRERNTRRPSGSWGVDGHRLSTSRRCIETSRT
jgi:hypothetical protein